MQLSLILSIDQYKQRRKKLHLLCLEQKGMFASFEVRKVQLRLHVESAHIFYPPSVKLRDA